MPTKARVPTLVEMVEMQVYAPGIRAPDKLMGLDLELGAIHGVRYKADTLHDIIFLESDDPISVKEIRSIFHKLDLQARFVGPTQPSAQVIRP